MKVNLVCVAAAVCLLAAVTSCSKSPTAPVAPASSAPHSGEAVADGALLKVGAPTPLSPGNGSRPDGVEQITLVVGNTALKYGSADATYRIQLFNAANQLVADGQGIPPGAGNTTSYVITAALEGDQTY